MLGPTEQMKTDALVVIGVSGCGKSTVGKNLAERLGWPFFDADDYHPPKNVRKMQAGIPLTDSDREPWLIKLNQLLRGSVKRGTIPVLACSALKESYRMKLTTGGLNLSWVYLRGGYEEILARIESRHDHFVPASLLRSQFDTLEEPLGAWVFEIHRPCEEIVDGILLRLEDGS